jgi:N-methylhydantoinase B
MSGSVLEDGVRWDGRIHSYRTPPDWEPSCDPSLLHVDAAADLDPITYEVVRNRLWVINASHGDVVLRTSGSPTMAALDFNMAIFQESGEFTMTGPYVGILTAGAPHAIRYILDRLLPVHGVEDGDVYVVNDPWIAAGHQMDVMFIAPVFVEGRLFSWVVNAGHQYDLGGVSPGGWPQDAVDVYSDPFVFPPFKLVERGELRRDLEALYLRQSRFPDLVALDLRAQVAGVRFARTQLVELCERYSPAVVKSVMRRISESARRELCAKLEAIPDGRWSDVRYLDEALPGDRATYRTQLNVSKQGDRLVIDNEGTDPQIAGVLGITFAAWSGAILTEVAANLLYEQLFAAGGAEPQIDFRPTPGLLTCVDHPAEVSGGIMSASVVIHAMRTILASMLDSVPELRDDVMATSANFTLALLTGQTAAGDYYGSGLLEAFACGTGAGTRRDGVDTSAPDYSPQAKLVNVEMVEQWYPVLFLYRREAPDSCGAGRWRGGVGVVSGVTPYGAASMEIITNTGGQDISTVGGYGLCGGYPAPPAHVLVRRETNLTSLLAAGRVPISVDELDAGDTVKLRSKSGGTEVTHGDVFELRVAGAGGYGDPIEREPERVAADVARGYVSAAAAGATYGVAVNDDGTVDEDATARAREEIRGARSAWSPVAGSAEPALPTPAGTVPPRVLNEYLELRERDGEMRFACRRCGEDLGPHGGDYKRGLLLDQGPVSVLPGGPEPAEFLDDAMVFRRYCCPGCQVLVKTEIFRADEPILPDVLLEGGSR